MSYQQNSSRLRRLPDFFGITDSSGLIPLSQIRDNGIINNGAKVPTVAELEQQAWSGQPISLMDLAEAMHRERDKKKSVRDQLKTSPGQERKKAAPKKSAERQI